jgi:thiol-disulfide isomerase/thioredoxin
LYGLRSARLLLRRLLKISAAHPLRPQDALLASSGDKLVVVDFTAKWCGPCVRIAPNVDELAKRDDIVVVKVDVVRCSSLPTRFITPLTETLAPLPPLPLLAGR